MADFVPPPKKTDSVFADMKGHHVAIRVPDRAAAVKWYVEKLDFRVVAEWPFNDLDLAFLAPATDNDFYIEILGGGEKKPDEARPYADLGDSLKYRGLHHICLSVKNAEDTVAQLKSRGVTIAAEPFILPAVSRKLAFFSDPYGNLIEIAELLA